jgi:hypothetical protein
VKTDISDGNTIAEQKYDIGTVTTLLFSEITMVGDPWGTASDNVYIVSSVYSTFT